MQRGGSDEMLRRPSVSVEQGIDLRDLGSRGGERRERFALRNLAQRDEVLFVRAAAGSETPRSAACCCSALRSNAGSPKRSAVFATGAAT